MLVPRMNFYSDLKNHSYFFNDPDLGSQLSHKLKKKAFADKDRGLKILNDLYSVLDELKEFKKDDFNKACSMYLYD